MPRTSPPADRGSPLPAAGVVVSVPLLVNSFVRLIRVDPGFRAEELAVMRLSLPEAGYPSAGSRLAFFHRLEQRLEALGARWTWWAAASGRRRSRRG